MGALGGFAAGLADGIREGRNYKLREKQQDNEDKRTKWAEEDHAAKVDERSRMKAHQESARKLFEDTYDTEGMMPAKPQAGNLQQAGQPTQAAAPTAVANAVPQQAAPEAQPTAVDAQAAPAPQAKRKPRPGQDTMIDADYFIKAAALNFMHNGDTDTMMKASKYIQELKGTEEGKAIMGALSGDEAAKQQLFKMKGLDPATTKIVTDPLNNVFKLVTPNGEQDLRQMALFMGADKAYQMMTDQGAESRAIKKSNLETKAAEFTVNHQPEAFKTDQEYKQSGTKMHEATAKATPILAQASVTRANASAARANQSAKAEKYLAALSKNPITTVDANGKTIKSQEGNTYVMGIVEAQFGKDAEKNPDLAVSKAQRVYGEARDWADGQITLLKKDKTSYKAAISQFGGNEAALRDSLAHKALKKTIPGLNPVSISAPTQQGNLQTEED